MVTIRAAEQADLPDVKRLFRDYWAEIKADICFQNFGSELEGLPGAYAPPSGALFLARDDAGRAVGCAALRATEKSRCCEMKRLYIAPAARGTGLGRRLVQTIMDVGRRLGYREMRLDTLPELAAAAALYRAEGFAECPPFGEPGPVKVLYFSRAL